MTISTYTELQTAITNWTDQSGNTVFTNRETEMITIAEAWLNRKLRCREMITTATVTPVSGTAALPSDFLQVKDVIWTGSPVTVLEEWDDVAFQGQYGSTSTATPPRAYLIRGTNLLVGPRSDTPLTLVYYQKIPALSASNTTNWLLTSHPDLYLFASLVEGAAFMEDAQAAGLWKQRRDEILDEVWKSGQFYRGPTSAIRLRGATP